jgi:hypothetical protein|tara:strand:+ start:80 stop:298 length:219 start_codon:yes stop_codon:yes gene_type:complete
MKIVLSLIICSALAGECKPPFQHNKLFEDWSGCMYQGYSDSVQLLNVMGSDYINQNKIFIKFACKEIPDKTA